MIPIINKPTRVTRKSASAIDHIITNCFAESNFKAAIFKSDVSDHFPIGPFFRQQQSKLTTVLRIYIKE